VAEALVSSVVDAASTANRCSAFLRQRWKHAFPALRSKALCPSAASPTSRV